MVNKVDRADAKDTQAVLDVIGQINPGATVVKAASKVSVDDPDAIKGKRVLCIEDGPTLTHGEMSFGAAQVAAERFGAAEVIDPRPQAVGSIAAPGTPRVGLWLLGILASVWLVYAGTLQAPWVFDDHKYLVDPVLHPTELSVPALLDAVTGTSREAARWLPNLSFALQFYTWGSESTLPFHLFNVTLHCLVVWMVLTSI